MVSSPPRHWQPSVTESVALPPNRGMHHVADYRAYIIGTDGQFFKAIAIDCDRDEEAIERAKTFVDGHDVELWEHARKVAAFKHKSEESRRAITYEIRDGRMIPMAAE